MGIRTLFVVSVALIAYYSQGPRVSTHEMPVDAGPPTKHGLVFWLDAKQLTAQLMAHAKPSLENDALVGVWFDASGKARHFVQHRQSAQPRYVRFGNDRAVVRFDGKDDALQTTGLPSPVDAFTAFIVAAPRSNAGDFRAILAAQQTGQNDYTSAFTIDMNGPATGMFQSLNVEGKGFVNAANLLKSPLMFGEFHVITVSCRPGDDGVRVWIDGKPAGSRRRDAIPQQLDHFFLGARCYSLTSAPPHLRGFFDGDIAEVLLFDRALEEKELTSTNEYLRRKHKGLTEASAAYERRRGHTLKTVAQAPPVQMLAPGFSVHQLPVDLTNINNVRYRPDGNLLALAYSGEIYLLSDSDGDGLEDTVQHFWENKGRLRGPIGMALTPPGYPRGDGAFVSSKGKLSLIVDTDRDGKADKEIVVADGWKEIPQNVDALGVALDKDGSIYFGLGTANYANGYLLDKEGKGGYDIKSERGAILKVSPDFTKREIVCTGIRFPVALAFNRHGDLFSTDQEGATWLPNGNPFDELLHIQPGRHYGFPPRHPKHLPNVIDEPSVVDYGPQHQSTCGMVFNESVNGGPVFGPKSWEGDALVCGESRGKLYRTKLIKTASGYVAHNHLIACLNMLTVDCCVSPRGELVVATHSGPPDWGTGPLGKGKLYKIRYRDPKTPQPVLAFVSNPREVRIAFDRELDPSRLSEVLKNAVIEYGPHVQPGDRFEVLRPPYAIVDRQLASPRHYLPIHTAQITPDRRTLVFSTAPHVDAVSYAITLPGLPTANATTGELRQETAVDIGYTLNGVHAVWAPNSGGPGWNGWLPHFDLSVSGALTAGSTEHDVLWKLSEQPGRLALETRLDLWKLLHPAIQPGTKLDYVPDTETVHLALRSERQRTTTTWSGKGLGSSIASVEGKLSPLEFTIETDKHEPNLKLSWSTTEDPERERSMPLRRFFVPWATKTETDTETVASGPIPQLKDGNWIRGRDVFFGEQAACSKCHQVRGRGGLIGPDLSNLVHRDYASVLRDITDPNATLNPEYLSFIVHLQDGRMLTGVPRSVSNDKLILGDDNANETTISRDEIAEMQPATVSAMPKDLDKKVTQGQLRDLLTFLLTEPLTPARLELADAPPTRRRTEVAALLKSANPLATPKRKIVLVAGPKDHGPGEHDYPLWQRRWENLLSLAEGASVTTATNWPTPRQWETADVIVMYSANSDWTAEKANKLDAYLNRGGGLVLLHYAVNGRNAVEAFGERIGLAWRDGFSRYRHGPLDVSFRTAKHPITDGFSNVRFVDESYWNLVGDPKKVEILASSNEDGQAQPLLWTYQRGKGRVFVSILGHYTWTFDDPLFRILLLRGMAWTAGDPVNRWIDLATVALA